MTAKLENLEPQKVWRHFATLCRIPRASNHEAELRQHLLAWAESHGIETQVDGVGNLILRKEAIRGFESAPGVALQGHLDMVCQANSGTRHDFLHDPIGTEIEDGWLFARDTTLGADNGIGVALALALLEEPALIHPPLEVLLTVNEESGMDGARGLKPGTLRAKTLINLDSEEWGQFYLGCAGGIDVEVRNKLKSQPAQHALWRIEAKGLQGGHSGIDIHLGRGNAILLLNEALCELAKSVDLELLEFKGGTARNAIPREASALVSLPEAVMIEEKVASLREEFKRRLGSADGNFTLRAEKCTGPTQAIDKEGRDQIFSFLSAVKNGVARMSPDFPGVVDTSSNLGVLSLAGGEFSATFKVRSLSAARAEILAQEIRDAARSREMDAWTAGAYPGWTPDPDSRLLELCRRVYREEFGKEAGLQVIHAGLECGLIAASHPYLDMISFGPDIRGAHAPGERVEIASVERCWRLLVQLIEALAQTTTADVL